MGAIQKLKRDWFRSRAYEHAAQAIRSHPDEILSGAQARKIEGIGDGMARRIDIVLETGELEELKDLQRDNDVIAIRALRQVHGIGVVRARKLIERGIRSLADLRAALGWVHLNAAETLGLAHAEEFARKIPRAEMCEHERLLLHEQATLFPDVTGLVCGSYRRGAPASGDIDFLMAVPRDSTSPGWKEHHHLGKLMRSFLQSLRDRGYITGDLMVGSARYMGVCRLPGPEQLHRRLDVRCFHADNYAFGTLYFTGPKLLSIRLRVRANDLGMTLNEYGLTRKGTREGIVASTEREIFEALDLEYVEPTKR